MKTLTFTSSNESLTNYTWDLTYPITKIVDENHVCVINDLGAEDCVSIEHFNNGLLKTTDYLMVATPVEIYTDAVYQQTGESLDGLRGYLINYVGMYEQIVWITPTMILPFSVDELTEIE